MYKILGGQHIYIRFNKIYAHIVLRVQKAVREEWPRSSAELLEEKGSQL